MEHLIAINTTSRRCDVMTSIEFKLKVNQVLCCYKKGNVNTKYVLKICFEWEELYFCG